MENPKKTAVLVVVLILIVSAISFLQKDKVAPSGDPQSVVEVAGPKSVEKEKLYERAKEISSPDGFINTGDLPITLGQYVGKKVVILDIWTYSCINCLRTLPYLNDWYKKYEDKGLVIIGLHTPEFQFEKDINNVKVAVAKYGIKFPVVLDNDYSTWNAYKNLYWPRKYIIDIDGFIRYDHIGEGGYDETEKIIQGLLEERATALGTKVSFNEPIAKVPEESRTGYQSPETYFGASRNQYLGNGTAGLVGEQKFSIDKEVSSGKLFYFDGSWNVRNEYAENTSVDAKIVYPFIAGKVFLVASAEKTVQIQITVDGKLLGKEKGDDVVEKDGRDIVTIKESRLYNLFSGTSAQKTRVLEIRTLEKGLKAFTFTFGN